jgi:predicted nucleic acid-binding protein
LIDERKGTTAALRKGLDVTGTLGVLDLAARRGLVDLADAIARLKRTNFRYRQELFDCATEKAEGRRRSRLNRSRDSVF